LEAAGNPKALIQVGPWIYPLNKETTAVMKNAMGKCFVTAVLN
jgi:hypothetical protein